MLMKTIKIRWHLTTIKQLNFHFKDLTQSRNKEN